jgi:hypothetical protein
MVVRLLLGEGQRIQFIIEPKCRTVESKPEDLFGPLNDPHGWITGIVDQFNAESAVIREDRIDIHVWNCVHCLLLLYEVMRDVPKDESAATERERIRKNKRCWR